MNVANCMTGYDSVEKELQKKVTENQLEVPMLPEVARKVVQLCNDQDSDASAMSKLIQGDQTLAVQVMRIANSVLYNPSGASMVSLQQAITRLGMRHIGEVALAASLQAQLFDAPGYETHITEILSEALATALWAKEIARASRKNVEASFLSGLMHDIGRPACLQSIIEIARTSNLVLSRDEVFALEEKYHQVVGLSVVKSWDMPTTVCDVVEHLNDYQKASNNQTLVMIVVAGALFSENLHNIEESEAEERKQILINSQVMADLNFYAADTEALLQKLPQVKESLGAMTP